MQQHQQLELIKRLKALTEIPGLFRTRHL